MIIIPPKVIVSQTFSYPSQRMHQKIIKPLKVIGNPQFQSLGLGTSEDHENQLEMMDRLL
jgi:hypothetical protein